LTYLVSTAILDAEGATVMNISLTPELEDYVTQKVESGLYQTASEVIREALRMLREREELRGKRLEDLRREIAVGLEQANQGKLAPLDARGTLAKVRKRRRRQNTRRR
jgi:antitoxin ParD1/3/4